MHLEISIFRFFVWPLLWLSQFFSDNHFVVVCKGYGEDWKNYTGLYWGEDKDNDFSEYKDFRVWVDM